MMRRLSDRENDHNTCFDIEKAYDKIHHQNSIHKLSSIAGLYDDLVAFLLNYLSNRTVVFKINKARSQPITRRAGTPQQAILSPTLFNLWVSDIPLSKLGTHLSQFADDITTYSSLSHSAYSTSHTQKS